MAVCLGTLNVDTGVDGPLITIECPRGTLMWSPKMLLIELCNTYWYIVDL